jgi:hypothetical protein
VIVNIHSVKVKTASVFFVLKIEQACEGTLGRREGIEARVQNRHPMWTRLSWGDWGEQSEGMKKEKLEARKRFRLRCCGLFFKIQPSLAVDEKHTIRLLYNTSSE